MTCCPDDWTLWLDVATAAGTVGAALVAAWAALIARKSLQQSHDLMVFERQARDDRVMAQARRVTAAVTQAGSSGTSVEVRNRSGDSIFKIFVLVSTGADTRWFHLREELGSGRVLTGSCDAVSPGPARAEDVPAWPTLSVWFSDADGRWWNLDARGELVKVAGPPAGYDPATTSLLRQTDQ